MIINYCHHMHVYMYSCLLYVSLPIKSPPSAQRVPQISGIDGRSMFWRLVDGVVT